MAFVVGFPASGGMINQRKIGFNDAVSKLLSIITTPFYITAIVLYYFDLRVRKERYDFGVGAVMIREAGSGRVGGLGEIPPPTGIGQKPQRSVMARCVNCKPGLIAYCRLLQSEVTASQSQPSHTG